MAAVLALAIGTLLWLAASVFPTAAGQLGHDYRYFAPYLLAGEQWVRTNGWLSPAYFTAAFCGGIPWLANPQSLVWSLPQLLFVLQGPERAMFETYVLTASAGAAATYFLMRRPFALSAEASLLAAIIFLLNSFLFVRMAVGHLTYHAIFLMPAAALAVMPGEGRATWTGSIGRIAAAGACFAAMVFGGALNFVAPTVLTVAALILIRQTRDGMRWRPWLLLAGAGVWSAGLSAIKLAPALVLMLQYPRPYLMGGLFLKWTSMLRTLAKALFAPELLNATESMGRGRLPLGHHELEFGIGIVPVILILAMLVRLVARRRIGRFSPVALILVLAVLAIPLALCCGSADWAIFLSHVPVINNNTMMTRWWTIFMMPLVVLGAVSFDGLLRDPRWRVWALAAASLVVMGQTWHRDLTEYTATNPSGFFDAADIAAAHQMLAQGGSLPKIHSLGQERAPQSTDVHANEALLAGASAFPCYEPVFGYTLEKFPAVTLTVGPVAPREDGTVNMADPRCYLGSKGEACASGTALGASKTDDLEELETYRPISWKQPGWQRFAAVASFILAVSSLLAFAIGLVGAIRGR
jgi:hypothetical protein